MLTSNRGIYTARPLSIVLENNASEGACEMARSFVLQMGIRQEGKRELCVSYPRLGQARRHKRSSVFHHNDPSPTSRGGCLVLLLRCGVTSRPAPRLGSLLPAAGFRSRPARRVENPRLLFVIYLMIRAPTQDLWRYPGGSIVFGRTSAALAGPNYAASDIVLLFVVLVRRNLLFCTHGKLTSLVISHRVGARTKSTGRSRRVHIASTRNSLSQW